MMRDIDNGIGLERQGDFEYAKPQYRAVLRDGRLSFGARGLFQFLWDLPKGWKPRISHLVTMSGGSGRDALTRFRQELESVGAVIVEPVRLSKEEANERNAENTERLRKYRAGQVVGTKWILVSPTRWAVEMPLGGDAKLQQHHSQNEAYPDPENPGLGVSGARPFRMSENQTLRFTKKEGAPNKDSPTTYLDAKNAHRENGPEGEFLKNADENDMRAALITLAKKRAKSDPSAWADSAIRRLKREPLSPEEISLLESHRSEKTNAMRKAIAAEITQKRVATERAAAETKAHAALASIVSSGKEKRLELIEFAIAANPVSMIRSALKQNRDKFAETGQEDSVSQLTYQILLQSAEPFLNADAIEFDHRRQ
ncbi:hypothetical protein [uncultured Propionivibrio sp.]|uniref:hypothetical protein n=1 Tax=uncultured Propionivibrio sp. TaxID=426737 RepID=UPI0029C0C7CF|nr:hypothetical protein [uncultured Propionivibrio sp.]